MFALRNIIPKTEPKRRTHRKLNNENQNYVFYSFR